MGNLMMMRMDKGKYSVEMIPGADLYVEIRDPNTGKVVQAVYIPWDEMLSRYGSTTA
jgi:hypothetical protein